MVGLAQQVHEPPFHLMTLHSYVYEQEPSGYSQNNRDAKENSEYWSPWCHLSSPLCTRSFIKDIPNTSLLQAQSCPRRLNGGRTPSSGSALHAICRVIFLAV